MTALHSLKVRASQIQFLPHQCPSSVNYLTSAHMQECLPSSSKALPFHTAPLDSTPRLCFLSRQNFPQVPLVSHSWFPVLAPLPTPLELLFPMVPQAALIQSTVTWMMLNQIAIFQTDLTLLDLSTAFNVFIWQPCSPLSWISFFSWIPREFLSYAGVLLLGLFKLQMLACLRVEPTELALPLKWVATHFLLSHPPSCSLCAHKNSQFCIYSPGFSSELQSLLTIYPLAIATWIANRHHKHSVSKN